MGAGNGSPTAQSTGAGSTGTARGAAGQASEAQGTSQSNTAGQSATPQSRSGVPLNGIATLNAQKKLGVAESPSEEKRKNDEILNQADQSIQRTQKETNMTPSSAPATQ